MIASGRSTRTRAVGITLLLSLLVVCVQAGYELHTSVYSFRLLRERCGVCINSLLMVAQGQRCDTLRTCDVYFTTCQRELGTPSDSFECSGSEQSSNVLQDTTQATFNLNDGAFLGISNPIVYSGSRWAGTQFYMQLNDRDISPDDIIDTLSLAIDVDIPVGGSISRTTYTGRFNNAQVDLSFRVVCAENYYGPDCTRFCNDSSCPCEPGYTGEFCETEAGCLGIDCNGNGQCNSLSSSCDCYPGYTGESCETNIDDCVDVSCNNGGTCQDGLNDYTCVCDAGYTGERCENDIDDCIGVDCGNGECVDGANSFTCHCFPGFTGPFCEINIDDCVEVTCSGNGQCVDAISSYTCTCDTGYTGEFCGTDIDDCIGVTCNGHGTCVDGINSVTCDCFSGYTGEFCETDIDVCTELQITCNGNGECRNEPESNSYICVCHPRFRGDSCDERVNLCANANCSDNYNGVCVNTSDSYVCVCNPGYTGESCDIRTESGDTVCFGVSCSGNGVCIPTDLTEVGYVCNCNEGYSGKTCGQATVIQLLQSIGSDNTSYIVGGVLGLVIFVLVAVVMVLVFLLAVSRKRKHNGQMDESGDYSRLTDIQLFSTRYRNVTNPLYGVTRSSQFQASESCVLTPPNASPTSSQSEQRYDRSY